MPTNNKPWDLGGSCWDDHTRAIRAWNGSDTKPLPAPLRAIRLRFCEPWYGVEIGLPRIAAWHRRNNERGTPKTGKVSVFERLADEPASRCAPAHPGQTIRHVRLHFA